MNILSSNDRSNGQMLLPATVGLLAGALYWWSSAPSWQSLALFANLFALGLYDWRYFRLPNLLTAAYFLSGVLFLLVGPNQPMSDYLVGAVVGLFFFPFVNLVYCQLRGRDGIGMGDAKLLAGVGLWLGWQSLPHVLLAASLTGLLYAGVCWASGIAITNKTKLPFGSFLSLAAWIVWLFYR